MQHFARHLLRFGQEHDAVGDLLSTGNGAHRRQRLQEILRIVLVHRRIDNARHYQVEADMVLGIFDGQVAIGAVDAALGHHRHGDVHAAQWIAQRRGGHADDTAAALLGQHLLDDQLGDVHVTFQVGMHQGLQVVRRVVGEGLTDEDAGVVDQAVHAAKALHRRFHDFGRCGGIADVAVDQRQAVRSGQLGRFADVSRGGDDVVAACQEGLDGSGADALRCAPVTMTVFCCWVMICSKKWGRMKSGSVLSSGQIALSECHTDRFGLCSQHRMFCHDFGMRPQFNSMVSRHDMNVQVEDNLATG